MKSLEILWHSFNLQRSEKAAGGDHSSADLSGGIPVLIKMLARGRCCAYLAQPAKGVLRVCHISVSSKGLVEGVAK